MMLLLILVMCYAATFAAMLVGYYLFELRPMIRERKAQENDALKCKKRFS